MDLTGDFKGQHKKHEFHHQDISCLSQENFMKDTSSQTKKMQCKNSQQVFFFFGYSDLIVMQCVSVETTLLNLCQSSYVYQCCYYD